MLTTSAAPDVLNAYQRCANAYVTKPADLETFISVLQTLTAFWCGVNQPPPAPWR
jgi:CheY-like chemotaxis protein